MTTWIEATHLPWKVRLEATSQFPDTVYLLQWLRETVQVPRPPVIGEVEGALKEKWPDRRYEISQDQKIGRLIVEG